MTMKGKRVLVTGVSGTVGDRVAARFVREGAVVRGLIRRADQAPLLEALGVEPVFGDITDKASVRAALQDTDYVVHAAAYLFDDWEVAKAANIVGVENLADEALQAGVERVIHISTVSVYGEPEAGEFDEASPMAVDSPHPYIATKAESERILYRAMEKGLECVILRPGAICAEHNSHWGDQAIERMRGTDTITGMHPEDMVPWVHTENLAEMCWVVCTHPKAANHIYHAVDGNYPASEFLIRIGQAMGKSVDLPNREPQRTVYACDKLAELGYRPVRSFQETMAALVAQARS